MSASPLPPGWLALMLDDVVEINDELRQPVNAAERATRKGPFPYYGATGQVGWIDGYRQDGEYVLLGEDGAPFLERGKPKAYLVQGKAWVNNHAHVLRGVDGVIANRFLLHSLNSVDYRGHVNGTTRLKLTQAAMKQLPLRVPPLPEQHCIVAKIEELFSDLDAGVATLERVRIALKRYRASVLKAAVDGRLTEQWREEHANTEPACYLLERLLEERRVLWDGCGRSRPIVEPRRDLPPLRPTWCWASVDQLLSEPTCNGISVKGTDAPPGVPSLRLSAMSEMGFDYGDRRHLPIPPSVAEKLTIRSQDFFVSRGNGSLRLVGRGTLAQEPGEQIVFPDLMIRLRFLGPSVLRRFLAAIWPSQFLRQQIEERARTTAGIYKISQRDVEQFYVPLPPLEEQAIIVSMVDESLLVARMVDSLVGRAERRSKGLRQAILARAFEGRLVPQDPCDEPASLLLQRIKTEPQHSADSTVDEGNSGPRLDSENGQT